MNFKELADKARSMPAYHLMGAMLSLTEDKDEKPLLELFSAKDAELTKLKADVVKLRTALEPFARGEKLSSRDSDSAPVLLKLPFGKYHFACLGHCRNAARALEETKS